MIMNLGAILGGGGAALGGILGGIGNIFSQRQARKDFRTFKRRQREAIKKSRAFADERVTELLDSPLLRMGREFLEGTFSSPEASPLADQLRKSIRVAQQSRGLRRGVVGAVSESRALGAFTQQLRASLLPQVQSFGTLPERLRQSVLGFELPIRIGQAVGLNVSGLGAAPGLESGLSPGSSLAAGLGGGISGAAGGASLGFGIANQITAAQDKTRLLELLENQGSAGGGGFTDSLRGFGSGFGNAFGFG
jgi:hypothetical protein